MTDININLNTKASIESVVFDEYQIESNSTIIGTYSFLGIVPMKTKIKLVAVTSQCIQTPTHITEIGVAQCLVQYEM